MDCSDDSFCWAYSLPELPPPPPLPSFLTEEIKSYLNRSASSGNLVSEAGGETCNLCSWAGADGEFGESTGDPPLPLSSLLVIVAVVSALTGAGLTAAILSFRRLRNRKFESGASESVRHLARKISTSSRPTLPIPATFPTTAFSENTYCEGPYNDKDLTSNIYAELHNGIPGEMWGRSSLGHPAQNCYLELKDLPNRCGRCLPPPPLPHWQSAETITHSPPSSTYYSDLDIAAAAAARHAINAHPV